MRGDPSRFRVHPANEDAHMSLVTSEHDVRRPTGNRRRLLIVEDTALVAMMLEDIVTDLGWDVVGPATALAQACQLARDRDIDAAILDVDLDGKMSWEAAEILKARGIPFAFSTGYDGATILPPQMGDCPVISKPFDFLDIKRYLQNL